MAELCHENNIVSSRFFYMKRKEGENIGRIVCSASIMNNTQNTCRWEKTCNRFTGGRGNCRALWKKTIDFIVAFVLTIRTQEGNTEYIFSQNTCHRIYDIQYVNLREACVAHFLQVWAGMRNISSKINRGNSANKQSNRSSITEHSLISA